MRQLKGPLLSLNRLETLTDGIFAIIITIMVLGIHVPEIPSQSSSEALLVALKGLIPQIVSYSVSFYLIAHFWMSHIQQLKMCICTNRTHIVMVFAFIFFVSFIPFTTSLVGEYSQIRLAVAIFHFSVLLVYIVSLLNWMFVLNSVNLISNKIDRNQIKFENVIHVFRIIIPIVGIFVSLWEPMFSYFVYLILVVGSYFLRRNFPETFSSCST